MKEIKGAKNWGMVTLDRDLQLVAPTEREKGNNLQPLLISISSLPRLD